MMRSLFSAISGLRSHQTFMDVVGNNIANVNTIGYKSSRVTFQDILSQTVRGAGAPQANRGGTNPAQVGLGTLLAGIGVIHTQGNLQATSKPTDLAIQGDGFFVLNDGTNTYYTRDGAFDLAVDGTLVNPTTGLRLMGWQADATGAVDVTGPLTSITIPLGQGMIGQASTTATISGNLDASALSYSEVTKSNSAGGTGTVSGDYTGAQPAQYVVTITTVDPATGEVTGIRVDRTVGGTTTTTNYAASGGAPVNIGDGLSFAIATVSTNQVGDTYSFTAERPTFSTSATVYDSLGVAHALTFTFTRSASNTWDWTVSSNEGLTVTTTPATPQVTFNPSGKYAGATPNGTIALTLANGAASPLTVNLDFSQLTQLAATTGLTSQTDGAAAGVLTGFTVGTTGAVNGVYSNGLVRPLGQIALASFPNPAGLLRVGGNAFTISPNSGNPRLGAGGSGGRGEIAAGFLEMSNVDLAQQFTDMIVAERGFQANSRVITASDEILQELVNLKR